MVDYNEKFGAIYYGSNEIEIVETVDDFKEEHHMRSEIKKYHFYFKNIDDLFSLLKSNKRLFKELKELFASEAI